MLTQVTQEAVDRELAITVVKTATSSENSSERLLAQLVGVSHKNLALGKLSKNYAHSASFFVHQLQLLSSSSLIETFVAASQEGRLPLPPELATLLKRDATASP